MFTLTVVDTNKADKRAEVKGSRVEVLLDHIEAVAARNDCTIVHVVDREYGEVFKNGKVVGRWIITDDKAPTIVNRAMVEAVYLRPGDVIVRNDFVRTVTNVNYHPVQGEVSISCEYETVNGKSGETLRFSTHEKIKKLDLA
ncbi:hypothetical protein SEA_LUCYEDI_90 [Mycobacterium phage Lucyedi]|nr:hypothetical protein SEA_LUCYEDI_90 [Mycobacterium phage Lucyedi]